MEIRPILRPTAPRQSSEPQLSFSELFIQHVENQDLARDWLSNFMQGVERAPYDQNFDEMTRLILDEAVTIEQFGSDSRPAGLRAAQRNFVSELRDRLAALGAGQGLRAAIDRFETAVIAPAATGVSHAPDALTARYSFEYLRTLLGDIPGWTPTDFRDSLEKLPQETVSTILKEIIREVRQAAIELLIDLDDYLDDLGMGAQSPVAHLSEPNTSEADSIATAVSDYLDPQVPVPVFQEGASFESDNVFTDVFETNQRSFESSASEAGWSSDSEVPDEVFTGLFEANQRSFEFPTASSSDSESWYSALSHDSTIPDQSLEPADPRRRDAGRDYHHLRIFHLRLAYRNSTLASLVELLDKCGDILTFPYALLDPAVARQVLRHDLATLQQLDSRAFEAREPT